MIDFLLPIGVLGILLAVVAQLCRLIEQAMLNRTIRKALETDPASVPVLADKLSARKTPPGLIGVLLTAGGMVLAVASLLATGTDRLDGLQIALVVTGLGLGSLGYIWWIQRQKTGA